ncbi:MAG: arylesterase [Xanthomonadaceae bacterium]|jgi:acyl-CoA thioesterase-1|nr:arylesterase [Xanthomonadaceae bacterium]MCZ8318347.1 arylesterase [Silanimonas sp.]
MQDRSTREDRQPLWARRAQQGVIAARWLAAALVLGGAALLAGCSGPTPSDGDPTEASAAATPAAKAGPVDRPDTRRVVLVMGDSLSAAYNLAPEQGWVALLDARLRAEGRPWRMVNASISGETSAGGAARIAASLDEHRPGVLVVELGANDGLRGLPLEDTRRNLEAMVRAGRAAGARVLVVGVRLPPNYGPEYTERFFAQFGEIAAAEGAAHLPFLLEPIAMDDAAFQADRLHPTAEAQPRIADHVWPVLAPLLDETGAQAPSTGA